MSIQGDIGSLIKEAELYRTQGLLSESLERYMKALHSLVENQFSEQKNLKDTVEKGIKAVENDMAEINLATDTPELSEDEQDLIMGLFSFSQTKEVAETEGAVALAKFGQYKQALNEFHRLLEQGILPVMAAKNIIRCHLSLSSPEGAVSQFGQWISGGLLTKSELRFIRTFLEELFKKNGIKKRLPHVGPLSEWEELEEEERKALDISSVVIQLDEDGCTECQIEFDVTFEKDNVISFVVPADKKHILDTFRQGKRFSHMQFYAPRAVFKGSGIVCERKEIRVGPRCGDYVLGIKVVGD
ncbi:MAG: hypothetical protein JRI86_14385 [Deltaproteobacteria bacterium]|nr:hypothetical protein [Deltaproteobacteria bacterium]